jgi:hypothetical protein
MEFTFWTLAWNWKIAFIDVESSVRRISDLGGTNWWVFLGVYGRWESTNCSVHFPLDCKLTGINSQTSLPAAIFITTSSISGFTFTSLQSSCLHSSNNQVARCCGTHELQHFILSVATMEVCFNDPWCLPVETACQRLTRTNRGPSYSAFKTYGPTCLRPQICKSAIAMLKTYTNFHYQVPEKLTQ